MLCLVLTVGASAKDGPPSALLEVLKSEKQVEGSVIGHRAGDKLEYIDPVGNNAFERVSMSNVQQKPTRVLDIRTANPTQLSSDGKWIASCDRQLSCTVAVKDDPSKRFSLSGKDLLTPLYWSQDDRLVFFVRKAPTWRLPPRCSLEDEWDVTLYEPATGLYGVLTTVCGGFPYASLGWHQMGTK